MVSIVSNVKMVFLVNVQKKILFFQEDVGAPLMCLDGVSGTWFLHGIMSREGECLPKSHPDVFADTSLSLNWIEKTAGIQ